MRALAEVDALSVGGRDRRERVPGGIAEEAVECALAPRLVGENGGRDQRLYRKLLAGFPKLRVGVEPARVHLDVAEGVAPDQPDQESLVGSAVLHHDL